MMAGLYSAQEISKKTAQLKQYSDATRYIAVHEIIRIPVPDVKNYPLQESKISAKDSEI